KSAFFPGELGMKYNLQKKISQFLFHIRVVFFAHRALKFPGFFEEVFHEAGMGLPAVPGAAGARPQTGHHANEPVEIFHRMNADCIKSHLWTSGGTAYVPFLIPSIRNGTSRLYMRNGGLVAELAYAYGSGPYSERIAGSTPAQSTIAPYRGA